MTEDINLNNPNNLNPKVIQPEPLPVAPSKTERIEQWNKQPDVKNNGIKAIDTERFTDIGKKELGILKMLAIVAILSLGVIAASVGYSVYKNGSLFPTISNNQSVNFDEGTVKCEPQSCNPSLTCESQDIYTGDFNDIKGKLNDIKTSISNIDCGS